MVGVSYLFERWSQETTQRSKEERQEGKTLTRRVYYLVQSELSFTRKPQNVYLPFINYWLKDSPGKAWLTLLHCQVGVCGQRKSPTMNYRYLGLSLTWFAMLGYCGLIPFLFIFFIKIYLVVCVTTCTHECAHRTAQVWRSEDSLRELLLSSHHVGLGNQTWVIGAWQQVPLPSERARQSSLYIFYHYPNNSSQTMWVKTAHIYCERVGFSSPGFMLPTSWCQPAGLLLEASETNLLLSSFKL